MYPQRGSRLRRSAIRTVSDGVIVAEPCAHLRPSLPVSSRTHEVGWFMEAIKTDKQSRREGDSSPSTTTTTANCLCARRSNPIGDWRQVTWGDTFGIILA
ncbi:hypothetical protein L596_002988 [Steinernema carpocapsae]|uniref:Uncharacterized protein n=1 Tax=Steinernema carpocapsae TaxID=34508 RepID=A0A4U8UTY6_STECR|nr:hypothetical protein L596_002988 [Steinernema carpocapsae]